MQWTATILGQPRSKANSRRMALNRRTGKMFPIKNEKCLEYVDAVKAQAQVVAPDKLLEGDLSFHGTLYYPNRRSDLDPSLLIDCLEGIVFKNDRQIKRWDINHGLDKDNPRAEITICEMG